MKKVSLLFSILASLALVCSCAHTHAVPQGPAPLVISPSVAPEATVALPYDLSMSATGGTAPYTWSIVIGTLPSGLALNASTGDLSGVPAASGATNFTVQVADSSVPAQTGTRAFAVTVNGLLSFSSSTLPGGTQGASYSATPQIAGGASPYTWSVASGSLPPGLSLNSSTGAIAGTPSATGSFSVGIQVTDSSVPPQTAKLFTSIVINPTLAISTTAVASGAVGAPYSATLNATGGVNQLTWSVTVGAVPAGLNLSSAGVISGTPIAAGSTNFTVQVTDSANPPRSASAALTLVVNAHLTVNASVIPSGTVGASYSFSPSVSGGTAPYGWSIASGSLPSGLSLNSATGAIAGTPGASGTSSFVLQVTDSAAPPETATLPTSIVIDAPLAVSSTALPTAVAGKSYSATLTASNAVSATVWAISVGSLPAGLTLNPNTGAISGSSSVLGTVNFTVQVTDSAVPPRTASLALSIATTSALSFTPAPMPDGITGVPYSSTLVAGGGVTPYTWSVISGSLPFGLTLSATTGAISGTCPGSGAFTFTVRVADSAAPPESVTALETIHINGQLTVTTTTLADAVVSSPYSATLQAFGGNGIYTWAIGSGSLPGGITLDPGTGIISGTPTAAGPASFTVQVTDTSNPAQTASAPLSLNVNAAGAANFLINGNYALLFQGFDANGAVAIAGSFDADGKGGITTGMLDVNRSAGVQTSVAIDSGTFAIDKDHRGTMTLHSALGAQTFQVAVNAAGTLVRFIEFDAPGPGVIRGNGLMKLRDAAAFSNPALTGAYAFGFSGSTSAGRRSALIGAFSADGAGGIGAGLVDLNSNGTVAAAAQVLPESNYSIAADGRGAMALNVSGLGNVSGILYVVSSKELFFVRTDAFNGSNDLLAGELLQQSGSPYSSFPLVGVSVLHMDGSSSPDSTIVGAGLISSTGFGTLAGTYDANDDGAITSISSAAGSYSVSSPSAGRGTMMFAGNNWVFYLVDSTTALVMDASGSNVMTGKFEGRQAGATFPTFSGSSFIEGSQTDANANVTFESGVLSVAPTGSFTGAADANADGVLSRDISLAGAITPSASGRIANGDGKIYYIISPNRLLEMDAEPGQTNPRILTADR